MKKYQRVLYTNKFTTELKSKLRIVSYDKRRSLKGNVYYVSFASHADIEYADRISKHLRNVTLKPFQSSCASEAQRKNQMSTCIEQESLTSLPISFSSPTTLSFLTNSDSTLITSETDSLKSIHETLEEHAMRVLGSQIVTRQNVTPTTTPKTTILVSPELSVNLIESRIL
jgi:hypothetical protein